MPDSIEPTIVGGRLPMTADTLTPVQAGNKVRFEDATPVTTLKSPLTVSSTPIALIVPAGAVGLVVKPRNADLRVALTSGQTATQYAIVGDGERDDFDCAGGGSFFLLRHASTDVSVNFWFIML